MSLLNQNHQVSCRPVGPEVFSSKKPLAKIELMKNMNTDESQICNRSKLCLIRLRIYSISNLLGWESNMFKSRTRRSELATISELRELVDFVCYELKDREQTLNNQIIKGSVFKYSTITFVFALSFVLHLILISEDRLPQRRNDMPKFNCIVL